MSDPIMPGKRIHPASTRAAASSSTSSSNVQKEASSEEKNILKEGPFLSLPIPFQPSNFESSMPYIACNEDEQEKTLAFLNSHPTSIPSEKKVHLGFSVWFNLDLISNTKPAYAIIGDIDNHVILNIYKAISEGLASQDDRFKFVAYFQDYLMKNSKVLFNLESLQEVEKIFNIEKELTRSGSWLSLEQSYQFIHQLHRKGHILFLKFNVIEDKDIYIKIHCWLRDNQLELDTLYTSNIIEWNSDALKQQAYLQNLKMIASPRTRFIQAYKPEASKNPIQFCTVGADSIQLPVKTGKKKKTDKIKKEAT